MGHSHIADEVIKDGIKKMIAEYLDKYYVKTTEVVIGDNEANEMRESANMIVNRIKTSGVCRTVDITLKNSITTHSI